MEKMTKPPNVLVYCEENVFTNLAKSLYKCLHSDKFVIYNLKDNQVLTNPWKENVALLVVLSENINKSISKEFEHYVTNGGKLLVLCSNFSASVVSTTVLPVEELIKIKYLDKEEELYRCKYHYSAKNASVLVADVNGDPVIIKVNLDTGILIASTINLMFEPLAIDATNKQLISSNYTDRCLPILKNLLTEHFSLEGYISELPAPTSGYIIVEKETELKDMMNLLSIKEICLEKSCRPPTEVNQSPELNVPLIFDHDDLKSSLFDKECYYSALKTQSIGRTVVFFPVVTSTMYPAEHLSDYPGLVVIANRQLTGKGRGDNIWISPEGCAAFTLHVQLSLSSKLGQRLSVMQHMASLAVVHSLRKRPGCENLDLRLKWPNDIYYETDKKIGGVLVTTTIQANVVHVYVGIGVNVSNQRPTVCINSIIQDYNKATGKSLPRFKLEDVIASTLTELEDLVKNFTDFGASRFLELYYSYWIHKDQKITLSDDKVKASVKSIDDYGFLVVETEDGKKLSLQPDGNRFDMLQNLIISKEI